MYSWKMEAVMQLLSATKDLSTAQMVFIIIVIVLLIVYQCTKKKETLKQPVMETARDKGKLAIGNRDYEVW